MYFSEKEKIIMEPLFTMINDNPNKKFKITLQDNVQVIAIPDSYSDSNNGLDDESYEEYLGIDFKILEIIDYKRSSYIFNNYLEINYHNYPKKIEVID